MMTCLRHMRSRAPGTDRFETGRDREGEVASGPAITGLPSARDTGLPENRRPLIHIVVRRAILRSPVTAGCGNAVDHVFGRVTR